MRIYKEVSDCYDFNFWSGAKDTVGYLYDSEVDEIISMLEDCYPEGMSETELNDFFWFEDDTIADWLGWPDFETLMKARSNGKCFDSFEDWEEAQEEEEEEEEASEDD